MRQNSPEIIQKMKVLEDEVYSCDCEIRHLQEKIYHIEKLKKKKFSERFSICNHKWSKHRENFQYGELYWECDHCGMYKG